MAITTYKQYLAYYLAELYHDKKKLGFWFTLCKQYDSEDIMFVNSITQDIIRRSKKTINNPAGLFIKLFFEYQNKNKAKIANGEKIQKALKMGKFDI
ncbi:MAG TPA: hypothetical protein PKK56_02970 [archaeon]|nr:hypothetical protein [archaeon]